MSRACFASPAISPNRRRRRILTVASWTALGLVGLGLLAACSGKGAAGPGGDRGKRDTKIRPEACSKTGGFDTNRDGKKDLFEVAKAGKITCRAVDLDFDGVIDQTTFYDAAGVVRRREIDLDGNGAPNMIESFKGGKLVLREIDGANLGRFDMWDSYDPASGQRTSRERDTNGDGRIDQYWAFAGARITVRFDRNEDGVPDEEGVLVWGEGFETAVADAGVDAAVATTPDAGAVDEKPQAAPEGALADGGTTKPRDGGSK